MPGAVKERIDRLGGFKAALESVLPDIATCASVIRPSTSAGLYHAPTGERYDSSGRHLFLFVRDASDSERFLKALHDRLWLAGLGWQGVSRSGALLSRSLVDCAVGTPERIVFEASPELSGGLEQEPREAVAHDGPLLDGAVACPDLDEGERRRLSQLVTADAKRVAPDGEKARRDFIAERIHQLQAKGCDAETAAHTAANWAQGLLDRDVLLTFDELGVVTVAEVLADPERFIGASLADPIEGVEYGAGKAKVFRRDDGALVINSFAHGGARYELRGDAADCPGRVRKACLVPRPDAEFTPVMRLLDEALVVDELEPPMRNLDGVPTEVRIRELSGLHMVTGDGANDEEDETSRLPPPAAPIFAPHDEQSLALLIERYIEFYKVVKTGGQSCKIKTRLPKAFVSQYLGYRDSTLPRVATLLTMPLVMPDGSFLATNGLHRDKKVICRIEPELVDLLPEGRVLGGEVKEAIEFLCGEWLADVATDDMGKAVLIAMALTVIERALFSERPGFFVTAGKRGCGKTTAVNMVATALTGCRAAATAWSPEPEERRKGLFSMLRQGPPLVVWDNIKLGTAISCPHIEKILTSAAYEDRVLSESKSETVSCTTVMVVTGNNIAPKGDLASRCFTIRINADRPDPENRAFEHSDPFQWTIGHRGKILQALYLVLLGNPRLRQARKDRYEAKTRFKGWWNIVGSAVEHAFDLIDRPVDFGQMAKDVEAEDESSSASVECLRAVRAIWGGKPFAAADVRTKIENDASPSDQNVTELRSLLCPGGALPSKQAIAWKLKTLVDAPFEIDGEVLTLKKSEPDQRGTVRFWLSVRLTDGK